MATADDYLVKLANCYTYKTQQYCKLLRSGYRDCILAQQVIILWMYLDLIYSISRCGTTDYDFVKLSMLANKLCGDQLGDDFTTGTGSTGVIIQSGTLSAGTIVGGFHAQLFVATEGQTVFTVTDYTFTSAFLVLVDNIPQTLPYPTRVGQIVTVPYALHDGQVVVIYG